MPANYNRISIIGISGSGKSTFSEKLGGKTGLPVYHMDKLFWGPNWQEIPEEKWQKEEAAILSKDRWILEGYIDGNYPERLMHSDIIIYLDRPGVVCAFNGLKRWWQYRRKDGPEIAPGCKETFDIGYLWTMFACKERSDIEKAIKKTCETPAHLVILKTEKEMNKYLREIKT